MKRSECGDERCIDCGAPATHERPWGMVGDVEIVELVCEDHDTKVTS